MKDENHFVTAYTIRSTDALIYRTTLEYDRRSRLKSFREQTADGAHETTFAYDADSRPKRIEFDGEALEYAYDTLGRLASRKIGTVETQYEYLPGDETHYGAGASTNLVKKITQNGMNFEYAYDNRGNIISEKRGELTTTYAYDALGQVIRVNDPHENATWVYNYDRGGNILSKVKYAYTTGALGTAVETIPYAYDDSNWKDKLTAYNGQAITYDAIGNPLNDGERQYEWEAGRRLKKLIVKGEPADGIEDGFDEGSATSLKLEFSNGNLLMGEISNTVISAKVYRKGEDVTDEYAATAFNWARTSGNESADENWNSSHAGMKFITVSANELSDDIQIQCTLTGTSSSYGSVDVNEQFIARHTRGVADSNDTLSIEDGTLFVTTDDDNYRLSGNELTALYPRLNGSVTANAWVYHTQPLKTIEFKYNSAGLRVQKKVTANGKSEVTDYTLHGKLVTHMTVGNDKLHFFYDAQSRPAKVNFNGVTYTYLHNLQGDVVGIIDKLGVLVVEYKYDAWGKPISIAGLLAATLGVRNLFRYRGYIYDEETELYYLRSRYYDCTKGRFVNSDIYCGAVGALYSHSSYTYCNNAPIVRHDSSGYSSSLYFDYELVAYLGPWGILALAAYWATVSASNAMTYRPRRSYTVTETNQSVSSGFGGAKRKSGTATSLVTRGAGTGRDKPQSVASEIGRIASRFGIFKCIEAAGAIADYLLETDRHGCVIQIQYPCNRQYEGFIVSDTYGSEAISINGIHRGVLYDGNVYCNVHPYGLPEAEWLADFHGVPEYMREVTYIPF